MADPKQLRKVLVALDKQLEQAGLALRQARSTEQALKDQMAQLQQYRWDYVKQAQQQTNNVLKASTYQQFHHFIARLDETIAQHVQRQQQASIKVAEAQQQWQQQHQRQQALLLLIEKSELALRQLQDKREQAALDEFATLQFVRK